MSAATKRMVSKTKVTKSPLKVEYLIVMTLFQFTVYNYNVKKGSLNSNYGFKVKTEDNQLPRVSNVTLGSSAWLQLKVIYQVMTFVVIFELESLLIQNRHLINQNLEK